MEPKPNYKRQRTERSRVKRTKAETKEKEKAVQVAERRANKAGPEGETEPSD
jgi:hypothetical protein